MTLETKEETLVPSNEADIPLWKRMRIHESLANLETQNAADFAELEGLLPTASDLADPTIRSRLESYYHAITKDGKQVITYEDPWSRYAVSRVVENNDRMPTNDTLTVTLTPDRVYGAYVLRATGERVAQAGTSNGYEHRPVRYATRSYHAHLMDDGRDNPNYAWNSIDRKTGKEIFDGAVNRMLPNSN